MLCNVCNQEYADTMTACPYCGASRPTTSVQPPLQQPQYAPPQTPQPSAEQPVQQPSQQSYGQQPYSQPPEGQQYAQYQTPPAQYKPILITTSDGISGKTLCPIGIVTGSTVHSVHIGKDFLAGFKTIVGGELKSYTEMMQEARKIAMGRMIADAQSKNADAIVAMRYASSSISQGAAEIIAYGTAVNFAEEKNQGE